MYIYIYIYILACSCRFHRQCSTAAQQCSYSWQFVREFTWSPVSHVVSPELHLECTWKPLEAHLESTWSPPGNHLWTTWSPLGFQGCTWNSKCTTSNSWQCLFESVSPKHQKYRTHFFEARRPWLSARRLPARHSCSRNSRRLPTVIPSAAESQHEWYQRRQEGQNRART